MSRISAEAEPPIFFRLPNAVLTNFLSEWLDIVAVGRLDAAMTTRALRPKFLQCLQEMKSTTVNGKTIGKNGVGLSSCTFLAWLSSRRINMEEIVLYELDYAFITDNLELPFLRKLQVSGTSNIFETNLIQVVKSSPALQSITIYGSPVVHEVLHLIADHCPLLEEFLPICKFSFDDLLYLLNKCSALKKLTLRNASERWKDDDCWERLRPFGHSMHEVIVGNGVTNPQAFADFIGSCSFLQELGYDDIEKADENEGDGEIADENHGMILLRAAQSCPLLEVLTFDTFSSTALLQLSRNCRKLREVTIWGQWSSLSVSDLSNLSQIETLEKLYLYRDDLTSEHLAVISGFRNLKKLTLNCTDDAIFTDGMFADTPISQSLEKIRLIGGSDDDGSFPISVLTCISACENLWKIELKGSYCNTHGLMILNTNFPFLKDITLGYNETHIVGLTCFITQCICLQKVTLALAHGMDDEESTARFLNHLSDLESFIPHIDFDYYYFNGSN